MSKLVLDEMLARFLPDVVLDYDGYMHPYMGVTDGTQSYISDLLVDRNTGKQYVLVSIEWKDKIFEFMLPGGEIVRHEGNHVTFKYLKKELMESKEAIFRDAKKFGITKG